MTGVRRYVQTLRCAAYLGFFRKRRKLCWRTRLELGQPLALALKCIGATATSFRFQNKCLLIQFIQNVQVRLVMNIQQHCCD